VWYVRVDLGLKDFFVGAVFYMRNCGNIRKVNNTMSRKLIILINSQKRSDLACWIIWFESVDFVRCKRLLIENRLNF